MYKTFSYETRILSTFGDKRLVFCQLRFCPLGFHLLGFCPLGLCPVTEICISVVLCDISYATQVSFLGHNRSLITGNNRFILLSSRRSRRQRRKKTFAFIQNKSRAAFKRIQSVWAISGLKQVRISVLCIVCHSFNRTSTTYSAIGQLVAYFTGIAGRNGINKYKKDLRGFIINLLTTGPKPSSRARPDRAL